ncbi:MAG TPA: hybrid sensor histidine kinase/response regulator [Pirellulales bacterium]|nr:hybrid sensor histidine kinase/response regulator [Pirellulales bacterium]
MSQGGEFSLFELFQEEARAHTVALSQGLLELETDAANPRRIEPLMRAAHSIKGASRIVGIDLAVKLAHVMEDVFVAAQDGNITITAADIDQLLRGTDLLAELATATEATTGAWQQTHADEIATLGEYLGQVARGARPQVVAPAPAATAVQAPTPAVVPATAPAAAVPTGAIASFDRSAAATVISSVAIPGEPVRTPDEPTMFDVFREEVRSHALAVQQGLAAYLTQNLEAAALEPLVDAAHAIRGAARLTGIDLAVALSGSLESLLAQARSGGGSLGAEHLVPIAAALRLFAELASLDEDAAPEWTERHAAEVATVVQQLEAAPASPATVPANEPVATLAPATLRTVVEKDVTGTPQPAVSEAAAIETVDDTGPAPVAAVAPAEAASAVVRVSAQSLNRLMGLAGESLVQARWLQPFSTALLKLKKHQDDVALLLDNLSHALPARGADEDTIGLVNQARQGAATCRHVLAERLSAFDDHAAQAEDLNSRLYHEVIVSRMRPFGDGAHGFPRLVRDMARQLGKQVRLEIDGLEADVDRDVLEKLEAPLTHLLRNAVDHGIEMPDVREAAGKSPTGLVKLEVRHRAGMLAITIADDGRGLDVDRIRQKIVERGLTTAELSQAMTPAEVLEFLFLPGFSTAEKVTEYSGRGVGLDVVQQSVRRIGGSVRITTRPGQGATFHLQLPITLSVLRAVIVEIDGEPYAFPHNRIDRLLQVPSASLRSLENRQFIMVDGQNVGVLLASQALGLTRQPLEKQEFLVLLVSDSTGQYGLIVDDFRGEQDLVVRPLDPRLGKVPNTSAAAILDDGSPVLIADVEDLIRSLDRHIQGGSLQRQSRADTSTGPKKKVLVVDDSITVREVERQILRSRGYDVTVAVDGQEGWNMVRAERFDLVISDVDMPRMNGLELVKLIRGEASLAGLPVIIVSYKERAEDRLRGLDVGANYYLTKSSFHDDTFLQAVRDCIGESA